MPQIKDEATDASVIRNLAGRFLGTIVHYCNIRGFGTLASITSDGQCVIEYPNDVSDCVHYLETKMLKQAAFQLL